MKLLKISDKVNCNTCACIGSFDGFHVGHRLVVNDVICYSRDKNVKSLAITFRYHPRLTDNLLFTWDEKVKILERIGLDYLLVLERKDMEITAEEFMKILIERFRVRRLVMGFNNCFGKNREGNPVWIMERISTFPVEVVVFPPIKVGGVVVSSTSIRNLLLKGNVEKANKLLSSRYSATGGVVKGSGLGRKLGFPTINLEFPREKLIPGDGVYVVYLPDINLPAVMHIGPRPTLGLGRSYEIHIPELKDNFNLDKVKVEFIKKIREVMKFKDPSELAKQIESDIAQIYKIQIEHP